MATYNKRGYKSPKEKEEKAPIVDTIPQEIIDVKDSTTAEVFNTLDNKANKIEEWFIENRKMVVGVLGGLAFLTLAYILYVKFVSNPKEEEAFKDMNQAQIYFQKAVDATEKQDSLFKLALKGGEGKPGFEGIVSNFSGTKAAKLAEYYMGISYLNLKDFKKAIEHLDNFSTEDIELQALASGATGDAHSELNKNDEAIELYLEAAHMQESDFTTPRFLNKAANLAILGNKKEDAIKYLTEIKEKYENTPEGYQVDAILATLK
jgi:tetratricopeptide (TPR) repeat protein